MSVICEQKSPLKQPLSTLPAQVQNFLLAFWEKSLSSVLSFSFHLLMEQRSCTALYQSQLSTFIRCSLLFVQIRNNCITLWLWRLVCFLNILGICDLFVICDALDLTNLRYTFKQQQKLCVMQVLHKRHFL